MSHDAASGLFGSVGSWAYRIIVHYGDQDSFSRAMNAHTRCFHGRREDQITDLTAHCGRNLQQRDLLISGH